MKKNLYFSAFVDVLQFVQFSLGCFVCLFSKTEALSVVSVQFKKGFLFGVFSHFGEQF